MTNLWISVISYFSYFCLLFSYFFLCFPFFLFCPIFPTKIGKIRKIVKTRKNSYFLLFPMFSYFFLFSLCLRIFPIFGAYFFTIFFTTFLQPIPIFEHILSYFPYLFVNQWFGKSEPFHMHARLNSNVLEIFI